MGRKEGLLRAISGFCPFGVGAPGGARWFLLDLLLVWFGCVFYGVGLSLFS
jgi:hypothetical protein